MSADVELLPCGQCGMPCRAGEYHPFVACLMFKACHNSKTVRANLAPLQAEVESLRAEVERLTFEMGCLQQQYDERTAYMIVHRGAWLACSDAVRSAYSDEHHRAERLAEALRWYAEQAAGCRKIGRDGDAARAALDADGGGRARAALEQEDRND